MDACKQRGVLRSLLLLMHFYSYHVLQGQGLQVEKLLEEPREAVSQLLQYGNEISGHINAELPLNKEQKMTDTKALVYGRKMLQREALEDLSCRTSSCKLNSPYASTNSGPLTEGARGYSKPASGGILESERLIPSGPDPLPLDACTRVFPLESPIRPNSKARKPILLTSAPSPIRPNALEAERLVPSGPDPLHHSSSPQRKIPPKKTFSMP
ncbi:hypothetical protein O6H91_12G092100 [Diphasiastrum complanatum]|uniref:Uncharacterized protein n=1 Tax=Diphasiastrum complanatum TaxID=34168 RepID=A0ACC2C4U6_DIPCM|nr:hypothetical protein O6H91_12G092100 [Diphasiastrum complanatum]